LLGVLVRRGFGGLQAAIWSWCLVGSENSVRQGLAGCNLELYVSFKKQGRMSLAEKRIVQGEQVLAP